MELVKKNIWKKPKLLILNFSRTSKSGPEDDGVVGSGYTS